MRLHAEELLNAILTSSRSLTFVLSLCSLLSTLVARLGSVSNFLDLHPGGAKVILNNVGKDATKVRSEHEDLTDSFGLPDCRRVRPVT